MIFFIDCCLPKSQHQFIHAFQVISQWAAREALPFLSRRDGSDGVNKVFIKKCLFQGFFKFHLIESQISYPKSSCLKQKKNASN